MTLAIKLDPERAKVSHCAKYLSPRPFRSKVIVHTHMFCAESSVVVLLSLLCFRLVIFIVLRVHCIFVSVYLYAAHCACSVNE